MPQTEKEMIEAMFQRCAERGWIKELVPSTITEQEIADFEEKYQLKLPHFYKSYLMTYQLPHDHRDMFHINGITDYCGEINPLWLALYSITSISDLHTYMECFREIAEEYNSSPEQCSKLLPIGDWGAGWGPLCIDLTKDEQQIEEDKEETWSLVWFDHEEMDWSEYYKGENGLLHGTEAAPDFKTLLERYFCGSLEPEFEEENKVKVSYERLNSYEFCTSYWEDKWKD